MALASDIIPEPIEQVLLHLVQAQDRAEIAIGESAQLIAELGARLQVGSQPERS